MLHHPTLDQLKALRLDGMAEVFIELQAQDATGDPAHAEWLPCSLNWSSLMATAASQDCSNAWPGRTS